MGTSEDRPSGHRFASWRVVSKSLSFIRYWFVLRYSETVAELDTLAAPVTSHLLPVYLVYPRPRIKGATREHLFNDSWLVVLFHVVSTPEP